MKELEKIEHTMRIKEIAYRLVYMRPNPYSEEALTIGVLLSCDNITYLRTIQSESAYSALGSLFGENGKEQISFALSVLRSHADKTSDPLNSFESPADIISLGTTTHGVCEHPERFAHDLLEISSSLYRTYTSPLVSSEYVTQDEVSSYLFESVTKLNALKATTLFKGLQVQLSKQSAVKVPISGDRIIGGAVSMVTKQIGAAKTQAEAQIARYSIAGRVVNRQPAIYVLTPGSESKVSQKEIDSNLSELCAIAEGLDVWIRHERDLPELAQAVLRDEAA